MHPHKRREQVKFHLEVNAFPHILGLMRCTFLSLAAGETRGGGARQELAVLYTGHGSEHERRVRHASRERQRHGHHP